MSLPVHGARSALHVSGSGRRRVTEAGGHGHSWSAAAATPRHLLAALPFLPPPPPIPQRELFPLPRLFIPSDRGWSRDWCFLLAVSFRPVAMVSSVALLVFGHEHCSHLIYIFFVVLRKVHTVVSYCAVSVILGRNGIGGCVVLGVYILGNKLDWMSRECA